MKGCCASAYCEDTANLPCRLAASSPFQALYLPWRQGNAVHNPAVSQLSAGMSMEEDGDELQSALLAINQA